MGLATNNPLSIDIHLDGANIDEMAEFNETANGFTFNPTLFKGLGVKNYFEHCQKLSQLEQKKPLSLEVLADDEVTMISQAHKLSSLGNNIYVKVPITFTNGEMTTGVIEQLTKDGLNLNITAVFTVQQVQKITPILNGRNTIISIFAGRLFDIGINAEAIISEIIKLNKLHLNSQILWASPRQIYDLVLANKIGCDIITIPPSILRKISLFGKSPEEYSVDTVKMFFKDSVESGYSL